ncbi:MAG: hypothetical protein IBX55_23965 [Methyloprofundus sp.]|nr:hypothetical protein [Methyloprofundus sp.]
MNSTKNTPSKKSLLMLNALKNAVNNELEKKRRLGQYAVLWENDQIIYTGEDTPNHQDEDDLH